jgi:hypothetical protein
MASMILKSKEQKNTWYLNGCQERNVASAEKNGPLSFLHFN